MATNDAPSKLRRISMTGAAPVQIADAQWPIYAQSSWHGGLPPGTADRSCWLKVRRHADGRSIVYGGFDTKIEGERELRGGELVPVGGDLVAAIKRVSATCNAQECLDRCLSALPPVAL